MKGTGPRHVIYLAALALLAAGACSSPAARHGAPGDDAGDDDQDAAPQMDVAPDLPPDAPHIFIKVDVSPANALFEVDLGASKTVPMMAVASYTDGFNEIITDAVTWTVESPAVGSMMGTSFVSAPRTAVGADSTLVTAHWNSPKEGMKTGQARLTVVSYRMSGPRNDFFFVLPYQDAKGPMDRPLSFSTAIKQMDVFFAMDTTGSMDGEVQNLSKNIGAVMDGIKAKTPDTQAGLGLFEDFPIPPYGNGGDTGIDATTCFKTGVPDQPFSLLQPVTADLTKQKDATKKLFGTAAGYTNSAHGCGYDVPEAYLEALHQIATGEGLKSPGGTLVAAHTGGRGGVEFRDNTLPVIVQIGDAPYHTVGEPANQRCGYATDYAGAVAGVAHGRKAVVDEINALCAKYVGIDSEQGTNCSGVVDYEKMATDTDSLIPPYAWGDTDATRPAGCPVGKCCTGYGGAAREPNPFGLCPAVARIKADGTGLDASIITTINALAKYSTFDVSAEKSGNDTGEGGEMLPAGKTTADFLVSIVPLDSMPPAGPPTVPKPDIDLPTNSFHKVTPETVVQFTVTAFNDFYMQDDKPHFFRAKIKVVSDQGCSDLDARDVFILVPPKGAGTVGGN